MWNIVRLTLVAAVLVGCPTLLAASGKFKEHKGAGVKDRYIILLPLETPTAAVDALVLDLSHLYKLKVEGTWYAVKGFVATGKEKDAMAAAGDKRVELVEQDLHMRSDISSMMWTTWNGQDLWFLDRLDEVYWDNRFSDATEDVRDYSYNRCPAGNTTTAYIIDQPVWASHSSIAGRVTTTIDCHTGTCVARDAAEICRGNNIITFTAHSHGTAVASLLSGAYTGAALPEIVSLNIWPCSTTPGTGPTQAGVLAAINEIWMHVNARKASGVFKPSVVNHSGYLYPWDANAWASSARARDFVQATNVPYFTSADNYGTDSCLFAPNTYAYTWNNFDSSRAIFVVGGSAKPAADGIDRATWNPNWGFFFDGRGTNLGACVSAFAPGDAVYAAANGNAGANTPVADPNYYRNWGAGTSWASPLTAGVALRKLHEIGYQPTYASLYNWLLGSTLNSKAPVDTTVPAPGRSALEMCYNPTNPADYYYSGTTNCPAGMQSYVLPGGVTNTSNARMISWARGCQVWE